MPGVLWPKFEEQFVGENLAITGAIKDDILDIESIAMALCGKLRKLYPELLCQRYKLASIPSEDEANDYDYKTKYAGNCRVPLRKIQFISDKCGRFIT